MAGCLSYRRMALDRHEVWWVSRPQTADEEEPTIHDYEHLRVRLADEWYAINSRDQLIVPVTPVHRLTQAAGLVQLDADPGLLVQYGGADLALEWMTASSAEPTEGTEWYVTYDPRHGFGVSHSQAWSPPFDWVQTEMTDAE